MDLALSYAKEALEKARHFGLNRLLVNILGNMGLIYMQCEDYDSCIDYCLQASQLAMDMGINQIVMVSKVNIQLCLIELARFHRGRCRTLYRYLQLFFKFALQRWLQCFVKFGW